MIRDTEDVVARLSRKQDGYPQTGRGTIDATGRGTVEMDPAPQVYVNPDGHAAIKLIQSLSDRIDELREHLTDIRNRILCPVGPTPTLDEIEAIASAALHQEHGSGE